MYYKTKCKVDGKPEEINNAVSQLDSILLVKNVIIFVFQHYLKDTKKTTENWNQLL